MAEHINTFTKGLDTDTNPLNFSNEHYYYAKNFRLLIDEELSSLTLTNGKGIELMFTTYSNATVSSTIRIVGACEIDNTLVIFTTNSSGGEESGVGRIYTIPLPLDDVTTPYNLVADPQGYLLTYKTFNFGTRLKTIPRIEKGDLRKVYWVDGVNPVRYINIDDTELASKDVEEFSLIRRCLLGTPTFVQTIGGNLLSGVYKYSYCLFNVNGSETSYSDLSQPIPLSEGGLVSDTTNKNGWDFYGSSSSTYSGKGIQVSITQDSNLSDLQDKFDNIRIVRLYYSNQTDVPTITIIHEGSNESTTLIDDTGSINLGTLVYEEFIAQNMNLIPSIIETKNDYLFLGNIIESNFDVDYDARAYRFNSGGEGRLYNATTLALEWEVSNYGYNVPDTYDCLNLYNLVEQDNYTGNTGTIRSSDDDCKYQSNGTTLGGTGVNVSYEFVTTNYSFSDTTNTYYLKPEDYNTIGYSRDEVYRFGVVFYNKYGDRSFVKWIGDIRMPNPVESPICVTGYYLYSYVKVLGIRFTLSNLPADVTGYQIVRLPRGVQDQTVVDTGYIGHFASESSTNLYFGGTASTYTSIDSNATHRPKLEGSAAPRKSIVEYMCGETNYNKNNSTNYNRVDVYQGASSSSWLRTGMLFPHTDDNVSLTYIYPTASKVKYTKTLGTQLVSAVRDDDAEVVLPAIFGPTLKAKIATAASDNRGLKGTTLLLKLYADLTTSDTGGGTVNYPGYSLRRNHVRGYGGFTYEARSTNEYIPCSPITPYNTLTVDVYGGDTFISWFEYNRILWYDDDTGGYDYDHNKLAQIVRMLVESKINFTYTTNLKMTSYERFVSTTSNLAASDRRYLAMYETIGSYLLYRGGGEYFTQDFDLYQYNPAYSANHYENTILPKPLYFTDTTEYPVRVYKSEKKFNGELSDSWSKISVNNYKDLDSKYGRLIELKTFNNYLYAFQPTGIAVLAVEDREVIQSSNTSVLSVGTGGVLERYDYISNSSGTNFGTSIVNTLNNIYYVDDRNKKICLLTDKVTFLSDLKGIISYMGSKDLDSCSALYNPKFGEIWFSLDDETLVYNEYTQTFTSTIATSFVEGLQVGKDIIAYEDVPINVYNRSNLFRLDTGNYGAYTSTSRMSTVGGFDDIPSSVSYLKFVVNPNNKVKNRFDSIDISNHATLANGTDYSTTVTFTKMDLSTKYQTYSATFHTASITAFRTWRLNTIRGTSNDRFHDGFMKVELEYDPSEFLGGTANIKFNVNDIVTHYIPTFIR